MLLFNICFINAVAYCASSVDNSKLMDKWKSQSSDNALVSARLSEDWDYWMPLCFKLYKQAV